MGYKKALEVLESGKTPEPGLTPESQALEQRRVKSKEGEQATMEAVTPPTPPPVEIEEVTDTGEKGMSEEEITELKQRVKELEERIAEKEAQGKATQKDKDQIRAEVGATKCPHCGNIVGWNTLPVEKYDENEVNGNKKPLFPRIIIPLVYGKRCPVCKHFEEGRG